MRWARASGLLILTIATLGAAGGGQEVEVPRFPDITLSTLDGGTAVKITDFRGRPVLLTFWASWCGPCRIELPELQKLYGELAGEGFVLLTINVDSSPELATRFMAQVGVSVPVYRVSRQDLAALGVSGLPMNILLDREGRPVQIYAGYSPAVPSEIRRLVLEMTETEDRSS